MTDSSVAQLWLPVSSLSRGTAAEQLDISIFRHVRLALAAAFATSPQDSRGSYLIKTLQLKLALTLTGAPGLVRASAAFLLRRHLGNQALSGNNERRGMLLEIVR